MILKMPRPTHQGTKVMKRIFIILIAVLLTQASKAQTVTDTLAYLKTFETNKASYIGKPFSNLLDSLQIDIRYFGPLASLTYDKSKETSTRFYFIIPEYLEDIQSGYIQIFWEPYLNADQSSIIFDEAADNDRWNTAAKAFYKNGIIKDIKVR